MNKKIGIVGLLSALFIVANLLAGQKNKSVKLDDAYKSIPELDNVSIEPSGELSFGGYLMRYAIEKTEIPSDLLERIKNTIIFAFEQGATEEISHEDLDHGHLLHWPGNTTRDLNNVDGILLHSFEWRNHDHRGYKKRNIFSDAYGHFSIIPCSVGEAVKNMLNRRPSGRSLVDEICTVYPSDLGMVGSRQIEFSVVDTIPQFALVGYEVNIRQINGMKVIFGLPRFLD